MPTVLLIDDLPDDREIYEAGLGALGYEVRLAAMADGVTAAAAVTPSAIILHLGESDHWNVCDELFRVCGDVPVIALTAAVRPDRQNRDRARATANCAAFVGKPCTADDLAVVIARVTSGERGIELSSGTTRR